MMLRPPKSIRLISREQLVAGSVDEDQFSEGTVPSLNHLWRQNAKQTAVALNAGVSGIRIGRSHDGDAGARMPEPVEGNILGAGSRLPPPTTGEDQPC